MLIASAITAIVLCGSPLDMLPAVFNAGETLAQSIDLPNGSIEIFAKRGGSGSYTVFYATAGGNLCAIAIGTGYKFDKEASHVPN